MATLSKGPKEAPARGGVDSASAPSDTELLGRFAAFRDESAFAQLVRRHAPLVWGVCRRVLRNEQDAEDAFQAAFVVLAGKAGVIRKPELLGNWLYGVASRVARKARARVVRREQQERQAAPMAGVEATQAPESWQDVREVLDEELAYLPSKYRAPLVLCYLEGMTNEEAARKLGWPVGSMSYRLARGRELLRSRLTRRARALPLADFDAAMAEVSLPLGVPEGLLHATVKGALGEGGRPNLSPAVLALVAAMQPAAPGAGITALKVALIILTTLGVVAAGAYAFGVTPPRSWFGPPPPSPSIVGPMPCGCHSAPPVIFRAGPSP
jgi:RNA polymerase sigma factor (sigma-70 family)